MNFIFEKLAKKAARDPNKLVAKQPDEDFIPYVCHYDQNTILTKNGELMQIIRVAGFSNSSAISELISLREAVRESILNNVKETKFALWFNTIRRKKNIVPKGEFKDPLSKKVNDTWIKENKWDNQYVNELYITVIIEGLDTSIVNWSQFLRSFSHMATKSLHRNFLQESHQKLLKVVSGILKETEEYGAKLLGFSEWEGVLYSEPMRFFGKIVNLYEERYPLSANDISSDLASHKIAFGDRELEVIGYNNKNFAAMFSLKEYFEVSTSLLDHILQLPFEFIITQSFDFTTNKKGIESREYQNYILQVSGDEDFRQISGTANFIESNKGKATDYGKQQITLMVISRNQSDLEREIKLLFEQFSSLGFVLIREDIFAEHCFWSQLPANFRYLRRQRSINTSRIAGFAALHNFPSGSIAGNKWGSAVTTFQTVLNTPYFFNFHDGDLGHSLVLGPVGSGKTTLINFLLAQSRKFDGRITCFDFDRSSKCFIKTIGGNFFDINQSEGKEALKMNPLLIGGDENKKFLTNFFTSLVSFGKNPLPQNELEAIPQIIERIIAAELRNFAAAVEMFNSPETPSIYERLKIWGKDGKLAPVFNAQDESSWDNPALGFSLEGVETQKAILVPIFLYLLTRFETTLTGAPSILVINEAWSIFDNEILSGEFAGFLDRMRQKNCVVILATTDFDRLNKSEIVNDLKSRIVTKLFLPNAEPHECYKTIFGLDDEGLEIIQMMANHGHNFLLKHVTDSIIIDFDLGNHVDLLKTLSADELTLAAMDEVITDDKIESWLPQFHEVLTELENERIIEEKERLRQEALARRKALMA